MFGELLNKLHVAELSSWICVRTFAERALLKVAAQNGRFARWPGQLEGSSSSLKVGSLQMGLGDRAHHPVLRMPEAEVRHSTG